MLVSIIIPIYNVAPYVEQCLQSIVAQTFDGELECLLVDDCGSDDSVGICERFISEYKGPISFRILHHDHNRGLSAARNTGIYAAQGEYIYFLDSDDWIFPACIEILYTEVKLHPGIDMVQGEMKAEDTRKYQYCHRPSIIYHVPQYCEDKKQCRYLMHSRRLNSVMQNRLLNTNFVKSNHLYCKEGIIHEDEMWTYMAGKFISSISYCAIDTYYYRANPCGIMSATIAQKHFDSFCAIADDILSNISLGQGYVYELAYAFTMMRMATDHIPENPLDYIKLGQNPCLEKLYKYFLEGEKYNSVTAKILRRVYKYSRLLGL